ncbi:Xanthine dehydrogenase [Citrobacter sedlakii]|uniref:XdhC family protein n=1 Tax=Citrobacter sedlakii TaxID=67826 RepID=UPI003B26CF59
MQQSLIGLTDAPGRTPQAAFLTDDSRDILRFALEALASGMGAALVTLVDIRGGAARPLGAQMTVREDGQYCGFVSGGCVEGAVAFEAMEAIRCAQDRTVRYGEGSPWFDIVLPCGGGITLNIHTLRSAQPLHEVLHQLERRQPVTLRYCPTSQTLAVQPGYSKTRWRNGEFALGFRPCVRVMIFGRSVEAQTTALLAEAAGYDVQLCADATLFPPPDADTAVLLLWHDLDREFPVLQAALAAKPFYIGALGSYRTHQKRVARLCEHGWRQKDIARINAPVGIFPKARDARSLALSVLADVAATRLKSEAS